ncbi:hypothetical protein ACU8KH_03202 [Lachancea thermotolerans]
MSSLQEQIASRKRRLESLKGKHSDSDVQQPHLPNEPHGEEDTPVSKKPKELEEKVIESPVKQDNDMDPPSQNFPDPRSPTDESQEEGVDTDSGTDDEQTSKLTPTSDLKEKLRPQLDELEKRTQEAIKRLVRQRLLTQPDAD